MAITQTIYPISDGANKKIRLPESGTHYNLKVGSDENVWKVDTYTMGSISRTGHVTNVRVSIRCQARPVQDHNQRSKTAIFTAGQAIQYGVENWLASSVWNDYYTDYALNPWTGVAWTWDEVDALQAGPSLIAYSESVSYAEASAPATTLTITSVITGGQVRVIGMMM